MRVLLVENSVLTARAISLALRTAKVQIDHTDMGEDGLDMARCYGYDVALVSLSLPEMSGVHVIRRLRAAGNTAPILAIAGNTDARGRVAALGAGADDVLTKLFDPEELVARIQALVRRSRGLCTSIVQYGALRINFDTHEVAVGLQPVALTGKEFAVLELLVTRKNAILTKDAFLNHLYGGMDEPESKIIDVFICKLRKKLLLAGAGEPISTVWGRGYMFSESKMTTDVKSQPVATEAAPAVTLLM